MIKAVFIDYGGTLFDYNPTNYQLLGHVARKYGIDIEDTDPLLSVAFQRQEEHMMMLFCNRGMPSFSLLSGYDWIKLDEILLNVVGVNSHRALSDLASRFKQREFEFQIYPDTVTTLNHLKSEGYKLGIISNLGGERHISQRYAQLEEHGLLDLFDVITLSGEIGVSKPSPEIFLRSVEKLHGVSANESLFVGDSYFFDVLGAKGAGMVPVLLDPNLGMEYDCLKIASFGDVATIIDALNGGEKGKIEF